jgi:hypothetical protein
MVDGGGHHHGRGGDHAGEQVGAAGVQGTSFLRLDKAKVVTKSIHMEGESDCLISMYKLESFKKGEL